MPAQLAPPEELIDNAKLLTWMEKMRIKTANRFTANAANYLGKAKHKDVTDQEQAQFDALMGGTTLPYIQSLKDKEKRLAKELESIVSDSVWLPFIQERSGLGEKTFGRLWAVVGNPLLRIDKDNSEFDRALGNLYQFCGVGDPSFKRYNRKARTRLFNITDAIGNKNFSPYLRHVYESAKANVDDRIHTQPCIVCGSKSPERKELETALGRPLTPDIEAKANTPWKAGHKHAHALRIVGKHFLKEWYLEAETLA